MKKEKNSRISVSLSDQDYVDITAIAAKFDISVAWLVRHAISDFLGRYKAGNTSIGLPLSKGE